MRKLLLVAAGLLAGCPPSPPTEMKPTCSDADADGVQVETSSCTPSPGTATGDCDDTRADRFPGNAEVAYDGIDQDCDGADRLDVDGDGYPGVAQSSWMAAHGGIAWPSSLHAERDCDETAATVHPGATDAPYDGVDANCDGADDFDADGDGHVPPDAQRPGYSGPLPKDDCDDTRADVHPGSTGPELPYDGIDTNCDGANDYNQDGDGYLADSQVAAYLTYLSRYGYSDTRSCKATDGSCNDCDDDPSNDGTQPKSAGQVHPTAPETWYDGVDQNCDARNDFDQDGDGYDCNGATVAACSGHSGADCDDQRGDVNPAAHETFGDSVDSDCSGDPNGPRFEVGGFSFTAPTPPDIARTNDRLVIGVGADTFTGVDGGMASRAAVAFTLKPPQSDGGTASPDQVVLLEPLAAAVPLGRRVAMLGGATTFTAAYSAFVRGADERTRLRVRQLEWLPSFGFFDRLPISQVDAVIAAPDVDDPDPYLGADVQPTPDPSLSWAAGCSLETVHFAIAVKGAGATMSQPIGAFASTFAGSLITGGGSQCWLEVTSATTAALHAYEGATYRRFALSGVAGAPSVTQVTAPTHATAALAPIDVRHRGRYVVLARGSSGVTIFDTSTQALVTVSTPQPARVANLAVASGRFFLAAVVDDLGTDGKRDLVLYVGGALSALGAPIPIPFAAPGTPEPQGVALYAESATELVVAVSGANTVGWAFLGVAP